MLVHVEDALPDLDAGTQLALYRLCQEALVNVVKHAHASVVRLALTTVDDVLSLMIDDDGRGFDVEAKRQSFGIAGFHARARGAGGTLLITSSPGEGTKLDFRKVLELASTPAHLKA